MAPRLQISHGSLGWQAFIVSSVVIGVAALAAALWLVREALLLAFAAAVFAVILLAVARPLERLIGGRRPISLALGALVIFGLLAGAGAMIGRDLGVQLGQLGDALPKAIDALEQRFGINVEDVAKEASAGAGQAGGAVGGLPDLVGVARTALGNLLSIGTLVFSAIAAVVVVIVGGFFLALEPDRYRRGLVLLFPPERHDQADEALRDCGHAIHLWLRGQLLAMVLVGLLSGLGAWAIGLPAPLAIGFFAGLTEFVPIIGPWIGAVPALLIAASTSGEMLAWTAALFLAVQQLESNVISPIAQHRMTDIPPFLLLFGVLALGLLFGMAGVVVAAPLTLVVYVLVTKLYIRDTLGQDVPVPGREEPDDPRATSHESDAKAHAKPRA